MIRKPPKLFVVLLMCALLGACVHPLSRDMEQMLREQLAATNRTYREAVFHAGDMEVTRPTNLVTRDLSPERVEELEEMSGVRANEKEKLDPGEDLTGSRELKMVAMSLARVIRLAVNNNRDLTLTRLVPAVRDLQITQAEAIFDAVAFSTFDFQKLDTPQPGTTPGLAVFGSVQQDTRDFTVGIRKLLDTGGQVAVSTNMTRNRRVPSFFSVNTFYDTDITVNLVQPLLRNFGSDVTRSQIKLALNAHEQSTADLKDAIMNIVALTEQAYWELASARQVLLTLLRLVRDSEEALRIIEARLDFDAAAEQVSQIRAFVAERRFDITDAQRSYRESSDQLKQLIHWEAMPLSGETLIDPLDAPVDVAIRFNIHDALSTSLRERPDIQRALSEIKDATIRQRVADNQRLPLLDLAATVRYNGVSEDNVQDAYDNTDEGNFIDYLVNLQFEQPIGNRAAEAAHEQRIIERRGSVINYERIASTAISEVKSALRQINSSFKRIGIAGDARLAAADTVRAIMVRFEVGENMTPELVDRWIRRKQELSRNEIQEIRAITDYNVAIARYYQTIGTLLERNGIVFSAEPVE